MHGSTHPLPLSQRGQDLIGIETSDLFGFSFQLSADGDTLAIGRPYSYRGGSGKYRGQVRVYKWDGSTWAQAAAPPSICVCAAIPTQFVFVCHPADPATA